MKKCPICNKPVEWQGNPDRPFCSERCKLIDFGNWADEEYNVPAEEVAPPIPDANDHGQTSIGGDDRL